MCYLCDAMEGKPPPKDLKAPENPIIDKMEVAHLNWRETAKWYEETVANWDKESEEGKAEIVENGHKFFETVPAYFEAMLPILREAIEARDIHALGQWCADVMQITDVYEETAQEMLSAESGQKLVSVSQAEALRMVAERFFKAQKRNEN